MGLETHALNFLRYTKKKKLLGDTITIGRQSLQVAEANVISLVGAKSFYKNQPYCEELLTEYFGATKVESLDNSNYEGATYIHDMNEPLPSSLCGKFDTVIDGGSLEHIFNIPQALKNCSLLCRPGGQIIHILGANNFCGHGFWQFSPELFFSLYSPQNGYRATEVFLAKRSDTKKWYRVKEPVNGQRVNVSSSTALFVLVRTVLQQATFSHSNVQQSDYAYEWQQPSTTDKKGPPKPTAIKQKLKNIPLLSILLSHAHALYLRAKVETGLNAKNTGLTMIDVKTYTGD